MKLTNCPHCGKTFYLRKTGGRPRKYCSDVCSKKADAKMALERQKAPDQRKKQRERRRKRERRIDDEAVS